MKAAHAGDLAESLADLHGDGDALLLLTVLRRSLEAANHLIGDVDPGDLVPEVPRGSSRPRHVDAGEDPGSFGHPEIDRASHELVHAIDVEADLRLDELRAGLDLLEQTRGTKVHGRRNGFSTAPIRNVGGELSRRPLR
jgi:hypothetical protein